MLTQVHFRGVHPVDDAETHRFAEHLAERLDRVVEFYREDQKRLRIVIEGTRQGYRVCGSMTVPSKAMYAEATGDTLEAAMETCFQRLAKEATRHRAMVRREFIKKRRFSWQEDLKAARDDLAKVAREQQRETFEDRLLPLLRVLYRTARRRIILHQLAGELEPNELKPYEVISDLVGWEYENIHKHQEDADLALELHQSLRDRLESYLASRKHDPARIPDDGPDLEDPRFKVEEDEAQVFYEPAEKLRWEDLVELQAEGDRVQYDAEAKGANPTQLIYRTLSKLDRARREPYMLHAIEGMAPREIAHITHRSEKDVKTSIKECERFIKHQVELQH